MTAGSADPLSTSWAELLREKRSLAAIVRDAGRLCVQDSVDIVLDVCDELASAHANGIVHGDLGLHRVRTMWPRRAGDLVDIWALDADDTGAIDFRAAFQAPALAPEQRAGRVGDLRSDIWAVGAILHALIGGAPPGAHGPAGRRPIKDMLHGAPRALVSIVEQCLADDPAARPRSVDDVAGALASFSSSSAERFQQLARRRIASLKARHVPAKVSALGRLDQLALERASSGHQPAAPQAFPAAAPVLPPVTERTVGALRPPTRPSYSDGVLPEAPVRSPSRPSFPEPSVAVEWPQIHGVPSMSLQVAGPDAPTKAQPRGGTLPVIEPLGDQGPEELPPTITAAALNARSTAPMFRPSMYPPSAAFPSAMPAAASLGSVPRVSTPSVTPPPVTVDAGTPAPYIPPAPPAYRQRSFHPPSFGPMSIDTGAADDLVLPPPGRVPSFTDLAEYREAKRASRRNATVAVVIAAAVLILGFGYGSRVLEHDRANLHAAEAAAAHAPAPPAPPVVAPVPLEAKPAAAPIPSPSATPEKKDAKPAEPKAAKADSKSTSKAGAPARKPAAAPRKPGPEPKAGEPKPDATPKDAEFTPNTAFSDAIGKKESAPANSLSDALK